MNASPDPVVHPDITVLDQDLGSTPAEIVRALSARLLDARTPEGLADVVATGIAQQSGRAHV